MPMRTLPSGTLTCLPLQSLALGSGVQVVVQTVTVPRAGGPPGRAVRAATVAVMRR